MAHTRCERSEIEHVRRFLDYAKWVVNETRYYPPANGYQYLVALSLYSKSITVAEAALALIDAGFSDEGFGLTRTLVDIYFTLRFISNKDPDERAKQYARFAAKDSAVWKISHKPTGLRTQDPWMNIQEGWPLLIRHRTDGPATLRETWLRNQTPWKQTPLPGSPPYLSSIMR